jgi:hypothetical protein
MNGPVALAPLTKRLPSAGQTKIGRPVRERLVVPFRASCLRSPGVKLRVNAWPVGTCRHDPGLRTLDEHPAINVSERHEPRSEPDRICCNG